MSNKNDIKIGSIYQNKQQRDLFLFVVGFSKNGWNYSNIINTMFWSKKHSAPSRFNIHKGELKIFYELVSE